MKMLQVIAKVVSGISKVCLTDHRVKLLGVVTLGALLVAGSIMVPGGLPGAAARETARLTIDEQWPFGSLPEEQMPEGTVPPVGKAEALSFEEMYPFGFLAEEQMPEGAVPSVGKAEALSFEEMYPFGFLTEEQMPEGTVPSAGDPAPAN